MTGVQTCALPIFLSTGGSLIPDFRDLGKVTRFVRSWRKSGYTACIAVSPAHLRAIQDNIRPSADEIDHAKRVVAADASDRDISFIDRMLAHQVMRQSEWT